MKRSMVLIGTYQIYTHHTTEVKMLDNMFAVNTINLANVSITLKEITDLLGVRHNDAMNVVDKMVENPDFGTATKIPYHYAKGNGAKGIIDTYQLNKRQAIAVAAKLNTSLLMRVIDRLAELEAMVKMQLPQDYPSALRALAQEVELKQLAIEQRDRAIATKAEIGERREATAMNTASQAVKRANKLEIELDVSKQYSSIKRMDILYPDMGPFSWKELKAASQEMGLSVEKVFDRNYGTVNAYHADAWLAVYNLKI